MQEGFLGSSSEIVWTPKAGKNKEAAEYKRSGAMERNEEMPFWWMYYYVDAKRCEKCGLILTR